ncbi:hypothetical protein EVAR_6828_1 [Eumeta japonica]|uniref:Uncharacterized protein n=1 Tax=Eumeta variegata TaxID=151549 RepID=A0A4C1U7P1_EUMVA|nr:hypothetical protein EVAR_6828_1 [Eumeta japonica]
MGNTRKRSVARRGKTVKIKKKEKEPLKYTARPSAAHCAPNRTLPPLGRGLHGLLTNPGLVTSRTLTPIVFLYCSALSLAHSAQVNATMSHAFSCVQPAFIDL